MEWHLGLQGDFQRTNASLAVALASTWLRSKRGQGATPQVDWTTALEPVVRRGLKNAFWPGRAQLWEDKEHKTRFYIDGAHTLRSLECCADWFSHSQITQPSAHVLIFAIHHERNVAQLFEPLLKLRFDRVYFCSTRSSRPSIAKVHTFSEALAIAGYQNVIAKYTSEEVAALDNVSTQDHPWQVTLSRIWFGLMTHVVKKDRKKCLISVKNSVVDCINELRALNIGATVCLKNGRVTTGYAQRDEHLSVLVTGSLYLGGEALDFLGWQE